ncbi:NUDIX domain-containing protein [Sphingomonas tabacisoli]|uniref:NUDIX domain-containing protein n=1 Tax=Sphingomonas tabacisoli TaxID=2249466 RepID=A0ABW4I0F2_9SPHN
MNESDFIASYDPSAFERPSVTVDLVLLTIRDRSLQVLLVERTEHPFIHQFALPGSFVPMDETLDEAAQRVLRDKAGMPPTFLEQLYTFGDVKRDPRMRVISVAYFALLPHSALGHIDPDHRDLATVNFTDGGAGVFTNDGVRLTLPFDHGQIVATAVDRLRAKLDWSDVAFALLPQEFTLRELQEVHEVILGRPLNKPAFRTRMLGTGRLEPTGRQESGHRFRPAELYRLKVTQ